MACAEPSWREPMALDIEEWEIWHTYTTFLESTAIDLQESARRLVVSGLAECAMLRDGRTYWRSNGTVESGSTVVEEDSLGGRSTFTLKLDEGCKEKPVGFALEAWGQASCFLISERTVLGDETALPPPYLRAFLGKCELTSINEDKTSSHVSLYPMLIVYESFLDSSSAISISPRISAPRQGFLCPSGSKLRPS